MRTARYSDEPQVSPSVVSAGSGTQAFTTIPFAQTTTCYIKVPRAGTRAWWSIDEFNAAKAVDASPTTPWSSGIAQSTANLTVTVMVNDLLALQAAAARDCCLCRATIRNEVSFRTPHARTETA